MPFPQGFRTVPPFRSSVQYRSVTIDNVEGYLPATDPYFNTPSYIAAQLSRGELPAGFTTTSPTTGGRQMGGVFIGGAPDQNYTQVTIGNITGFLPNTSGYFDIPPANVTTITNTIVPVDPNSDDADFTRGLSGIFGIPRPPEGPPPIAPGLVSVPPSTGNPVPPTNDQLPPLGDLSDVGTIDRTILGDCDSTGQRAVYSPAIPRQSVLAFIDVLGDADASRTGKFNASPFTYNQAMQLGTVAVSGIAFPENEGWVRHEYGGLEPSHVGGNIRLVETNIVRVLNDPIARQLLQENHPTYWAGAYGAPDNHVLGNQLPLPTQFYDFARGFRGEAVGPFFQESAGTDLVGFDAAAGNEQAQRAFIGARTGDLESTGVFADPRYASLQSSTPSNHLNHVQHVVYYTRERDRELIGYIQCDDDHNHGGTPPSLPQPPTPTPTPPVDVTPPVVVPPSTPTPPSTPPSTPKPPQTPTPTPKPPQTPTPPQTPLPPITQPIPVPINAAGGYYPEVIFFGGDVRGATGTATVSDTGTITSIGIDDLGGSIRSGKAIADPLLGSISPPKITLSTPDLPTGWFAGRSLNPQLAISKEDVASIYEREGISVNETQLNSLIASRCGYFDPLAQTFLVPETNQSLGIFISSIDVCFSAKPSRSSHRNSPCNVTMEIRPCTAGAGTPSRDYLVDAFGIPARTEVDNFDINISDGTNILPSFDDNPAFTKFQFPVPVYIEPNKRYAFVLMANDSAYKVWVNDVTKALVTDGSLAGKVSDQMVTTSASGRRNHGGRLFKSQSGSQTWEEDENTDMMFRINRCEFTSTSGQADISVGQNLPTAIDYSSVYFSPNYGSGQFTPSPKNATIEYSQYQAVYSGSSTMAPINNFSANRDTTMPNPMHLRSNLSLGDFKITTKLTRPSSTSAISPVINTEDWQCLFNDFSINDGRISEEMIEIIGGGSGYQVDDTFSVSATRASSASIKVAAIGDGGVITKLTVVTAGAGFSDAAIVTESTVNGSGAVIRILGEEGGETGGNATFRYISKKISLSSGMDATDLRSFITAKMPKDTSLHVYFRVLSATDSESLDQKSFQQMRQTNPSIDHKFNDFREFEFDTGGDDQITYTDSVGSSYSDFNTFQIKVVGYSSSKVKIPSLKDIRVIALT